MLWIVPEVLIGQEAVCFTWPLIKIKWLVGAKGKFCVKCSLLGCWYVLVVDRSSKSSYKRKIHKKVDDIIVVFSAHRKLLEEPAATNFKALLMWHLQTQLYALCYILFPRQPPTVKICTGTVLSRMRQHCSRVWSCFQLFIMSIERRNSLYMCDITVRIGLQAQHVICCTSVKLF